MFLKQPVKATLYVNERRVTSVTAALSFYNEWYNSSSVEAFEAIFSEVRHEISRIRNDQYAVKLNDDGIIADLVDNERVSPNNLEAWKRIQSTVEKIEESPHMLSSEALNGSVILAEKLKKALRKL